LVKKEKAEFRHLEGSPEGAVQFESERKRSCPREKSGVSHREERKGSYIFIKEKGNVTAALNGKKKRGGGGGGMVGA